MTDTPPPTVSNAIPAAVAVAHRFATVADILDGFADGIDHARLYAGLHWVRTGEAPAGDAGDLELMRLFSAPWLAAKGEGEFDGDPDEQAANDIAQETAMAQAAALAAAMPAMVTLTVTPKQMDEIRAGGTRGLAVGYDPGAEDAGQLRARVYQLQGALLALLEFAELAETRALVGDEGCLWPCEAARATLAEGLGGHVDHGVDLDELLIAMARAHDQEEAAQKGEPSPWRDLGAFTEGGLMEKADTEFVAERVAAMREALLVALKTGVKPSEGWAVVPREPTLTMLEAWGTGLYQHMDQGSRRDAYAAMLAAAQEKGQ